MSPGWKMTIVVVAAAAIVSTPLLWLLDDPDTGQLVGASVQAATGIAALVWAMFQSSPPTPSPRADDVAVDTGKGKSTAGGSTQTGVRRPNGAGNGSAQVERTGDATADGSGSSASTGIDYS
ncbi:hypothetical protein [Streptomyces sp. YIM B13502]|uniref:hypothetical protein n=1 Tax=Streptomyces sp. YIM B13502 TaxID=3366317 RepID=UPI003682FC77